MDESYIEWQRAYVSRRLDEILARTGPPGYPTAEAIARARRAAASILSDSLCAPSVVPGEDGAVDFVWNLPGLRVEVEIGARGLSVWTKRSGEDTDQWWFWTPSWQAGEAEADDELKRGDSEHFPDSESLMRSFGAA